MDLDELVALHMEALLGFARVLTGDRGLAEDLVQDTLLRLHQRGARLAEIDNLEGYARRMIVNAYLSWGRKWFRVRPTADMLDGDPAPDHAEVYADRAQLRELLYRLPRKQRAVIVLRFFAGCSDAEIAEQLGCSTSTVRSHASRALATLRLEHAQTPPTERYAQP